MIPRRIPYRALLIGLLVLPPLRCTTRRPAATDLWPYREPHRPQLHFSPPAMWMNDPNGLVFFDGEYHLFYQFHPRDIVWGPMHWGHAVSGDLVHWRHLPIALYPDSLGYIFSGSVVVDRANTSGFGENGEPPLVAIFTYHDPVRAAAATGDHETQGVAYSTDRGRTWTKYEGNPVLPNREHRRDFRDPKVFRHEPSGRWVMALAVGDHVEFRGSPDLKDWRRLSEFGAEWGAHGGTWECPDLFPLRVEGTDETKWVLLQNLNPGGPQGGSGTQYFVGDFDGTTFSLDESFAATLRTDGAVWLDQGSDDYAGVTWSDIPATDGRRIFIGWMGNWDYAQQVPTTTWRSAMTLPRTLRLVRTRAGYRVFSEPVRELTDLRLESAPLGPASLDGTVDYTSRIGFPIATSEVRVEVPVDAVADFGIELSNRKGERYRIGYDAAANGFYSDRTAAGDHAFSDVFADRVHRAPRLAADHIVRMRIIVDVASAELFADDGATVMTETYFPSEPFDRIALYSANGETRFLGGEVHRLSSIW